MKINEILSKLCIYDKRNPDFDEYLEEDYNGNRKDCYCDNCFYGRDELVKEILKLRAQLSLSNEPTG